MVVSPSVPDSNLISSSKTCRLTVDHSDPSSSGQLSLQLVVHFFAPQILLDEKLHLWLLQMHDREEARAVPLRKLKRSQSFL